MIHGVRGGVVGAAATMGVIVGASIPMFLGAMIVAAAMEATVGPKCLCAAAHASEQLGEEIAEFRRLVEALGGYETTHSGEQLSP